MPASTMSHSEQWRLIIALIEGDEPWPDTETGYNELKFQPKDITVSLIRGTGLGVELSGWRLKADGTPGRAVSRKHYYRAADLPDWLAELIRSHRKLHNLTPEVTGVNW